MSENIKITMLGTTAVGKSCYMIGMYAIMRGGIKGFTFSTAANRDLELSNAWEQLLDESTGKDRWPKPNAATVDKYRFSFNYGFDPFMEFEWIDYRGGALNDAAEKDDVKKLKEHMKESSCIFLCVSGELLARPAAGRMATVRTKARIDRMNLLMTEFRKETGRTPPVVIVITKFDLCAERDPDELIEEIREMYAPLFLPGSGWLTMICPVSMGMDLTDGGEHGEIEPLNVHLPVVFAIYCEFRRAAEEVAKDAKLTAKQKEDLASNWFWAWLNEQEINDREEEIKKLKAQAVDIERRMKLLGKELMGNPHIYLEGKKANVTL